MMRMVRGGAAALGALLLLAALMRRQSPPAFVWMTTERRHRATLHGAAILSTEAGACALAEPRRGVHRRTATDSAPGRITCLDDLAGEAARGRAWQHLAARYRLRRAGPGDGAVFSGRPGVGKRRRSRSHAGILLSRQLLDVLERCKARYHVRLYACRLVPGRDRWMDPRITCR